MHHLGFSVTARSVLRRTVGQSCFLPIPFSTNDISVCCTPATTGNAGPAEVNPPLSSANSDHEGVYEQLTAATYFPCHNVHSLAQDTPLFIVPCPFVVFITVALYSRSLTICLDQHSLYSRDWPPSAQLAMRLKKTTNLLRSFPCLISSLYEIFSLF